MSTLQLRRLEVLIALVIVASLGLIVLFRAMWSSTERAASSSSYANVLRSRLSSSDRGTLSDNTIGRAPAHRDALPSAGTTVTVEVKGAVRSPGVFHINDQGRIQDAIDAAGGLLSNSDVKGLDLAALVQDGESISIPALATGGVSLLTGDGKAPSGNTSIHQRLSPKATKGGVEVNINTASESGLEQLVGVGPTRAAAIIKYRSQHGWFRSPSDLQNVPGFGPKRTAQLQPWIRI